MKALLLNIITLFCCVSLYGQNQFHVFSNDHLMTPGTELGDGGLSSPWDLQTAFKPKARCCKWRRYNLVA